MWPIVISYLGVATWVYWLKYTDTPEERKAEVRQAWPKYWIRCLLWPKLLIDKAKGF